MHEVARCRSLHTCEAATYGIPVREQGRHPLLHILIFWRDLIIEINTNSHSMLQREMRLSDFPLCKREMCLQGMFFLCQRENVKFTYVFYLCIWNSGLGAQQLD